MALVTFAAGPVCAELSQVALYFREDWQERLAEIPVRKQHVANPAIRVTLHRTGALQIKKSHHDEVPNDPWYIWSGNVCSGGPYRYDARVH